MIRSTINFLLLLAGVVALYFAIRKTEPRLWTLCISFAIAGAITLVVIVTRRQLAQRSQAAAALGSWWDEMLVGGAPLIASPYGRRAAASVGVGKAPRAHANVPRWARCALRTLHLRTSGIHQFHDLQLRSAISHLHASPSSIIIGRRGACETSCACRSS